MKLVETRVERREADVRLVGVIEGARPSPLEIYFSYPLEFAEFVIDGPDPFVPALLVPCLKSGERLEIVPPISPSLLGSVGLAQEILLSWFPEFRRVEVAARARPSHPVPRGSAVATLFSGGVDSFYTLLKSIRGRRADGLRITHLVFMKGLEQPLGLSRDVDAAQDDVAAVAAATETTIVRGETNLRDHFNPNYELCYHGSALSAAALSLSGGLGVILIPSSVSYGQLSPWGSHPLLDPLWSTERLTVIHDGAEARRVDKLEALVGEDPMALAHLRVCLRNDGGGGNCGRCTKCVRTMVALAFLGTLERTATFPTTLPPDIGTMLRKDFPEFLIELIDLGEKTGRDPALLQHVRNALRSVLRKQGLRTAIESTPGLAWMLPAWRRGRRRLGSGTPRT